MNRSLKENAFILMIVSPPPPIDHQWSPLTMNNCGSPPVVIVADTLSFNAKMDLVDF